MILCIIHYQCCVYYWGFRICIQDIYIASVLSRLGIPQNTHSSNWYGYCIYLNNPPTLNNTCLEKFHGQISPLKVLFSLIFISGIPCFEIPWSNVVVKMMIQPWIIQGNMVLCMPFFWKYIQKQINSRKKWPSGNHLKLKNFVNTLKRYLILQNPLFGTWTYSLGAMLLEICVKNVKITT